MRWLCQMEAARIRLHNSFRTPVYVAIRSPRPVVLFSHVPRAHYTRHNRESFDLFDVEACKEKGNPMSREYIGTVVLFFRLHLDAIIHWTFASSPTIEIILLRIGVQSRCSNAQPSDLIQWDGGLLSSHFFACKLVSHSRMQPISHRGRGRANPHNFQSGPGYRLAREDRMLATQARRNAAGVGLVFEADLATDRHPSHWILEGVALVLTRGPYV